MVHGDSGPASDGPWAVPCHPSTHLLLLPENRISRWAQGCRVDVPSSAPLTAGRGHGQLLPQPWVGVVCSRTPLQAVNGPPLPSPSCWLDVKGVSYSGRGQVPGSQKGPGCQHCVCRTISGQLMPELSNETEISICPV